MSTQGPKNRLAREPSLYLRQHASNPVDWFPWGEEALSEAISRDRPILLSVGYSACHWCHVMARESFENADTAALMNELFVCIKVDREERPDLDALYMKALQAMTGGGGWPMTVFLTPDRRPFYAGTYFPPVDRGRMPAFRRVLEGVAGAFREQRDKVEASAAKVVAVLSNDVLAPEPPLAVEEPRFERAASSLEGMMDEEHGGFGTTPKFPACHALTFLLARQARDPRPRRGRLLRTTLDAMANGGLFDHVGGGFHRYSVDRQWSVPHFEKMLYDQALLARLYADAWCLFHEQRYRRVAEQVLDYVAREMVSAEGGFCATQDADSEGIEGKYFLWTPEQIGRAVGDDAKVVCHFFGVSGDGNFDGGNVLHRWSDFETTGRVFGLQAAEVEKVVNRACAMMADQRRERVAPTRDDKVLADWNGLMIGSMAHVGRLLGRSDLLAVASGAADFIRRRMTEGSGLLHFFGEGRSRVTAFLGDYAFFGRGCLELFMATGDKSAFDSAVFCGQRLIANFEDPGGGFFDCAGNNADLLVRTREAEDGAVPSANAVAAELLLRLNQLTADDGYRRAGEAALEVLEPRALSHPYSGGQLLYLADCYSQGFPCVIVVGEDEAAAEGREGLVAAALREPLPGLSVFSLPRARAEDWLPVAFHGKTVNGEPPVAYLCVGSSCEAPITGARKLRDRLRELRVS
ncbi:MAG: thioredoxin domain-containing protein [Candidatus Binatia bacterium]